MIGRTRCRGNVPPLKQKLDARKQIGKSGSAKPAWRSPHGKELMPRNGPAMNPLKRLSGHGQAVWLDFLSRGFIPKGGLKDLVDRDGVRGVTSNPSIFEQAIAHTGEYDDAVAHMLAAHDSFRAGALYEQLAVEDIRQAADVLGPVFKTTGGADGFVSLGV